MKEFRFIHRGVVFTLGLDKPQKVHKNPSADTEGLYMSFRAPLKTYIRFMLIKKELLEEDWKPKVCELLLERYQTEPEKNGQIIIFR